MIQSRRTLILLAVCGLLALLIGAFLSYRLINVEPKKPELSGTLLTPPRPITDFQLTDSNNKPFTRADFKGYWTFVFFGFTNCEMICPTAMSLLNNMYQKLAQAKQEPMPRVLFISVDPERDTIERLKAYATGFNPNFFGATGDKENLEKIAKQFGAVYMKVPNKDGKGYFIDHSSAMMLVDPAGRYYALFSSPQNAELMAKDFQYISANYKPDHPMSY